MNNRMHGDQGTNTELFMTQDGVPKPLFAFFLFGHCKSDTFYHETDVEKSEKDENSVLFAHGRCSGCMIAHGGWTSRRGGCAVNITGAMPIRTQSIRQPMAPQQYQPQPVVPIVRRTRAKGHDLHEHPSERGGTHEVLRTFFMTRTVCRTIVHFFVSLESDTRITRCNGLRQQ